MSAPWTWPVGSNLSPTGVPTTPTAPGFSAFWPDAPPTAPHPCDDEFVGAVIDPKWVQYNPGGASPFVISLDTTKRMASFGVAAIPGPANNARLCGLLQPVPHAEWSAIARVANLFNNATGGAETAALEMGMIVAQDVVANPLTADLYTFTAFQFDNSGSAMNAQGMRASGPWSAYNAGGVILESGIDVRSWIRMRANGAVMRVETSPDGVQWFRLWNGTCTFAPSYFGLSFNYRTGGTWTTPSQGQGYAKYFRVRSGAGSSGLTAHQIGRYV